MKKKTIKHLSDNALLAIYLALRAVRTGARRVYVTNDALTSHLRKQKVHKPQIHKFADTLQTIFPHHSVGKEHYKLKNGLFLYFTKEQYEARRHKDIPTERIRRIPTEKDVDEALKVQLTEFEA
ncbi:MAG TPA: hypothetical protein VE135_04735 [Pyrinomonadaceae bacterium]|nr:hypothetical protein [Pyrinomonadaceae bacterium]